MEDRERMASIIYPFRWFVSNNRDDALDLADQILALIKELGYTRQPEPQEELNSMSLEAMVKERDKQWRLYQAYVRKMKEMVSKPPQKLDPEPRYDDVFGRGAENMEKPEPTEDKRVALGNWLLANIREGCGFDGMTFGEAVREILKLFPEYEPVELEVLGDEEIIEEYESWTDLTPNDEYQMKGLKGVSQATLQKNQEGQLYRVKEV